MPLTAYGARTSFLFVPCAFLVDFTSAIEDFRANRKLEGPQLEKVLWNAVMEKQRLDKWMGTKDAKNPSRLKSDNEIIIDL